MNAELMVAEVSSVIERMKSLAAAVSVHRQNAMDASDAVKAITEALKQEESEAFLFVSMETDGSGKPRWSNEAMRKAETARRLNESPDHKRLLADLARAESEKTNAEIAYRQAEDDQKNWHGVVAATVAKCELMRTEMLCGILQASGK